MAWKCIRDIQDLDDDSESHFNWGQPRTVGPGFSPAVSAGLRFNFFVNENNSLSQHAIVIQIGTLSFKRNYHTAHHVSVLLVRHPVSGTRA